MKKLQQIATNVAWISIAFILGLLGCSSSNKNHVSNDLENTKPPLRIIFLADKSASFKDTVDVSLLEEALVDSVVIRGGMFIYSEIADLNPTFYKMELPMKPQMPQELSEKNPFKIKNRKSIQSAYNAKIDAHLRLNDVKFSVFANTLRPIIRSKIRSKHTDITACLEKLDREIMCSKSPYQQPYETYVIIFSDCQDDYIGGGNLRQFSEFKCNNLAKPIIIVGSPDSGNIGLKEGSFINMGSISEAIIFMFNQE
jgi:hypothetical protein